jgi:ribosomal protein S12 methylthiotransferase accessory factor
LRNKADFRFSPWDFKGSTKEEFDRLQALLSGLGTRLYRAEYLHCGMYSCRILAPGISEIYPLDDLVYNNRAAGAALRADILTLPRMDHEQLADFLDRVETLGLGDLHLLSHSIGIVFDQGSTWSTLRIGELKALLFLALGNHAEALHWCSWCIDYADLPADRLRLYRLLHTLLGFSSTGQNADDYSANLALLYGEEELRRGQAIVDGRATFPGLAFAASWTLIAKEHDKLMQIYGKLNDIKANKKQT